MQKIWVGIILGLSLRLSAQAPQQWFKVANKGDVIAAPTYHNYRFGLGTGFGPSQFMEPNNLTVNAEVDVLEESVPFTITVNNMPVIVPAASKTPPPPGPPTITLTLTINPVPVVINGTIRYSCTSVVLDNLGVLNLTCK